ncbi:MAG: hypothetical protein AB9869_24450 [Verrucomicrobiia bacterium]
MYKVRLDSNGHHGNSPRSRRRKSDLTTVPAEEAVSATLDLRRPTGVDPEFVRMGDLRKLFGIPRSTGYLLATRGLIRTVSLRHRGCARGIRLVSVESVRKYLNDLMDRQEQQDGAVVQMTDCCRS